MRAFVTPSAALTVALAVAALGTPSLVSAHVRTDWPKMATDEATIKTEPCGNMLPAADRHYFRPGQTINVYYTEFIAHEGHFRIAFAPTTDDLVSPTDCSDIHAAGDVVGNMTILGDGLLPAAGSHDADLNCPDRADERVPTTNAQYTTEVTLPDTECEDCLLQVIQYMTDKAAPNNYYYNCAYVTLTNDPTIDVTEDPIANGEVGPDAGPGSGGGGGGGNGDGSGGGDGTGGGAGGTQDLQGGCSAGGGHGLGAGLLGLAVLGLMSEARRRRRRARG